MESGDDPSSKTTANATIVLKESESAVPDIGYFKLYRYARRTDIALMALGLFMAFLAGAAFPLTTVVFGELINTFGKWQIRPGFYVTAEELVSEVSSKTIFFLYLALLTFITTYLYMSIFVYASERQAHIIREQYLKAVLRQNIGWFDNVGAGEVATRITSDTLLIQDGIGEKVPLALNQVATFISGFIIAFWKSWGLTLVLLSVVPLVILSAGAMNLLAGRFQTRILNLYSAAGSTAEETISAARTVTAFNAQNKMAARYSKSLVEARKEGIKKSMITGLGLGALFFFIYCAYSLAFYYGYLLLRDNRISPGDIVNVFFAVLIGAFALGQVAPDIQAFALGRGAGAKIFHTIDRVPSIDPYDNSGETIPENEFKGKLELKNVEFTYPSRPGVQVLNKVSLVIEPGTTVALAGQSGSGKSTIIQLTERFYDCDQGCIELDGIPLRRLNISWLRRHIGLVSQEPVLFAGTIAENVSFGLVGSPLETSTEDEKLKLVMDACRQANAHDFVMKLSLGYDTRVGDRGLMLSGGQKQRIAIARAIIKNPRILLLDEATSALDTASERIVQEALDRVSRSRTTITIAHRLSTIKTADKIVVMVRGEIVEQGNHQSLISDGGLYSRLVAAQHLKQGSKDPSELANAKNGVAVVTDPDAIPPQSFADEDIKVVNHSAPSIHKDMYSNDIESGHGGEENVSVKSDLRNHDS
ncbi:hypothetical protein BASA62_008434 [Batrachochytrium salamandrivorans]|nr:hypothetical protein BASA62_008434 [Batrachochytrium salamandrivorans]